MPTLAPLRSPSSPIVWAGSHLRKILAASLGSILALTFCAQALWAITEHGQNFVRSFLRQELSCLVRCCPPSCCELKAKYSDRVDFEELDVSQEKSPETKQIAKELGIGGFINAVIDYVPEVEVFSGKSRKSTKKLCTGENRKKSMKSACEKALEKGK